MNGLAISAIDGWAGPTVNMVALLNGPDHWWMVRIDVWSWTLTTWALRLKVTPLYRSPWGSTNRLLATLYRIYMRSVHRASDTQVYVITLGTGYWPLAISEYLQFKLLYHTKIDRSGHENSHHGIFAITEYSPLLLQIYANMSKLLQLICEVIYQDGEFKWISHIQDHFSKFALIFQQFMSANLKVCAI